MPQRILRRPAVWQLLLALMLLSVSFMAQAQRGGQTFSTIETPRATDAPGKIEVLEFFQYGCPHCRAMDPLVSKWQQQLGDDVVLQQVPVAFNQSMTAWQYLYYTLAAMNRLDLQPDVFAAVQTRRDPLNSMDRVLDWAESHNLDRDEFAAMYKSFGVAAKVKRANQLIEGYQVNSVPTFAVDGRFLTSPAQANGYQQTLDVVDTLIERIRAEG